MGNDVSLISDKEVKRIAQFSENDIRQLFARFQQLDKDKSGSLDPQELLEVSNLKDNPLLARVFSVFDTDGNAQISFLEFLVGIGRLSSAAASEDKLKFLFEVYDFNNDGFVSNADLFNVMKIMVGDNISDVQLQQLVDRSIRNADKDGDGQLSFDEFSVAIGKLKIDTTVVAEMNVLT